VARNREGFTKNRTFLLLYNRAITGSGRIYAMMVECTDVAGKVAFVGFVTTTVTVPDSQGK
jgi:hypothetical protein